MKASRPGSSSAASGTGEETPGFLIRAGLALTEWSERWFPEPLVFAFLGVVGVFLLGLAMGERPETLAIEGGKAFWSLVPFTMQMVMIIVGGFVVASAPLVGRGIDLLARLPKTPRGAVAFVALASMLTSLVSWGLSLVFSGLLVRALARRVKGLDYRAAGAAGYLGVGAVWAMGLSSSAALMMATKGAIPPSLLSISGVIPLTETIFLWPSLVTTAALLLVSVALAWASTPAGASARTAEELGVDLAEDDAAPAAEATPSRPGEKLDTSRALPLLVVALLAVHLVHLFGSSPNGALAALDLGTYNVIFLASGLLLHGTPRRFTAAVARSLPATGGVLIQYPFYAVIFGMIVGTHVAERLSEIFVAVSTPGSYPIVVAVYSTLLGAVIPSAGSRWIIEAPYVLSAANVHHVHLGWVVQIYNASEALPNLVNPFWMLPLLGILRLKARDLVGYCVLQLIVHVPLVYALCWLFARVVPWMPPVR